MSHDSNHCSFVLLAEFDIFEGAALKYQFPQPLGIDEGLLAMLMLPDGADTQLDDWTIFFLNQTPFNTISPVLALEHESKTTEDGTEEKNLLCVLNLVRTKHDKRADRGAHVRAMAICTRHPFIQIFQPVLLMAMDHYFAEPSQDCLADLFDAVNAMDLSGAPILTRNEKIVMRCSERKDIFAEKLIEQQQKQHSTSGHRSNGSSHSNIAKSHRTSLSADSKSSQEDGRKSVNPEDAFKEKDWGRERAHTESAITSSSRQKQATPPADGNFTLGGSAVWVGEESGLDEPAPEAQRNDSTTSLVGTTAHSQPLTSIQGRTSTDASSSSHSSQSRPVQYGVSKDTHFYHTTVLYKGHQLPIKMPLYTFPEEVGDYTLIPLIKTFSSYQLVSGPLHPHLHTGGPQTHPIIILFNALVTGKRIIFMGHKRPAGLVSSFVLSACALGSGCGVVLRGFIERAFPYAHLKNKDEWESVPGYIAGVTNLIFQSRGLWDVLFDVSSGQVLIHKDIHTNCPYLPAPSLGTPLVPRTGTLKAESSVGSEDIAKSGSTKDTKDKSQQGESADALFIEDIRAAIDYHFGESLVRMRFTEYVARFVRIASRYETETTGVTKIGFPSALFSSSPTTGRPQLGSGFYFSDENAGLRELAANANRVEGWKKTNTYRNAITDFTKLLSSSSFPGIDLMHQLSRLRYAKHMPVTEVELMMNTIAENCKTYDQAVELLAHLSGQSGGLTQLCFGLFHPLESVRNSTVDILEQLRQYPVGVIFLQSLNHFQRYAYVRLAQSRANKQRNAEFEQPLTAGTLQQQFLYPPPSSFARTLPNSSVENNVGAAI